MDNNEDREVLLRVEHLCQYFKSKGFETKAVDDVSFDVKKGEVFGLVGESGCGKTTTGRSIIRIYDITSGSIYFKGKRICAGTRSYKEAIKKARKDAASSIKALNSDPNVTDKAAKVAGIKAELAKTIAQNKAEIKAAEHDHKYSDREYAKELAEKVTAEYKENCKKYASDPAKLAELKAKYKEDLNVAKHTKREKQI